MIFRCSDHTLL